ncbi:hypothetical protein AXA84_0155 [Candidatus Phytoplasma oryzae]|uniref:DUF2130 domain-containing protein n=1 Tax=Candidatus Phytoplasma oryzae TaxID=203274 RepID=A0A139JQT5_9MOLU|nr:DUF2130 domain-containing protein [Candidatus Phytoplasma oryzae]KXT29341.1 hypothetical protein AXA84_0155 [Candidatus Phytoplasma oryzae]RAM57895.1 hypothetical protein DH96_01080 [Candidatus Phytoplasma oryzae]
MKNNIKVIIKNSYELELQENAKKGDIINLKESIKLNMDIVQKNIHDQERKKIEDFFKKEKEEALKNFQNQKKLEIQKIIYEHEKNKMKLENEKNQEIYQLKLNRSYLNNKLIGEKLEKWCDNEIQNQMLILNDISWHKDNEIIKGSKADFIFKLYRNKEKKEDEILTSAILEMKSEIKNIDFFKKKQKNEQYFNKLNIDRQNKNLEFALLISELEYDQENDLPIKKVQEYEKMYIIRPPYLVTFLNIIIALARKNKELIYQIKRKKQGFKQEKEIRELFENMKNKILNNYLKKIEKNLNEIIKENKNIKKTAENILSSYQKIEHKTQIILAHHFKFLIKKIENFQIEKIIKKINQNKEIIKKYQKKV